MQPNPSQRSTLEAIIRVMVHADPPISEAWMEERIQTILGMVAATSEAEQKDFLKLLDLLGNRIASWIFTGKALPFEKLPPERQVKLLQKWAGSRIGLLRKAFNSLKKLSLFSHYGNFHPGGKTWEMMRYPGPLAMPPNKSPRLQMLDAKEGEVLECDVVVVGSGAGGGIAAGILAEAGHNVIVLEKGPYMEGADFTDREADMIRATHDGQGALVTRDASVGIFAGSCLGGGTTVNWTASFETPTYVLGEWQKEEGLGFAMGSAYAANLKDTAASIHVNSDHSCFNPQNQSLWDGAQKLGRNPQVIARNVQGCDGEGLAACGYCSMGCRQGNKQGTLQTWLRRAAAQGTRILVHAEARQVMKEQGRATGVSVQIKKPGQAPYTVQVKAKRVIVAAGSIHSPALLLRSGLSHPGIGRNLFFHPTVAVAGFYDEVSNPWHGPMMTAVDKQGMHLDGNYGHWIETPPVHAGMAIRCQIPRGLSPAAHRADMARAAHMRSFVVLTRDKHGGNVRVAKNGYPVVDYKLHAYDRKHMLDGIKTAFEIHRAAGASEVLFPHLKYTRYKIRTSKMSAESYLGNMASWGWKPNQFALFTAHQMGTCAMGGNNSKHPFTPEGESRELKGLFIADGSAMPTSAGVNPMLSIMALAAWVAKGLG